MQIQESANSRHLSHPKYRADIDGLRAIAIIAVVAFHAFPNWLRGGFIGVDIFFVISGFLISLIIFESLDKNTFTFTEFYTRRIKRIFPALLIVLVTSYAAGWFLLFADEYGQLGKNIAGASVFISNFLFWKENGYFDNEAYAKPLLHLWTLGVEVQFYGVWPLILWAAWKKKFNWFCIIIVLAVSSFAFNIWQIHRYTVAAFYSPQTRFWELLVGAYVAYASITNVSILGKLKTFSATLLCALGIGLIVTAIAIIPDENSFPGWWALLPTTGTALIILAGSASWLNRTLLSNKLAVWIGLISYPLYLWHWPLLAFARIIEGEVPQYKIRIILVITAFFLAWLTYRFIEKPIKRFSSKKVVALLGIGMVICLVLGASTYLNNGLITRDVNEPFEQSSDNIFSLSRQSDWSCRNKMDLRVVPEEVCLTNSKTPKILFVGDSHAMALYSAIYAGEFPLVNNAMLISAHGCKPYANLKYKPIFKNNFGSNCTNIAKEAIRVGVQFNSISTIVLVNKAPKMKAGQKSQFIKDGVILDQETAFVEGSEFAINEFLKAGKKVIYMISVPIFNYDPRDCEKRTSLIEPKKCVLNEASYVDSRRIYMEKIKQLKNDYPNLEIFDPTKVFCRNGTCAEKDGYGYLYHDASHLSLYGSKKILEFLIQDKLSYIAKPDHY